MSSGSASGALACYSWARTPTVRAFFPAAALRVEAALSWSGLDGVRLLASSTSGYNELQSKAHDRRVQHVRERLMVESERL
jgi:hypothetical protein